MNRLLIFILLLMLLPAVRFSPAGIEDFYEDTITVQVSGEVMNEGLVDVAYGSTVNDLLENHLVELTEKADLSTVNLGYQLSDGDVISFSRGRSETEVPLISINNAGIDELCLLEGIGESIASDIVAYRNEHGHFHSLEELMQVKGIKEARFERIRKQICL